MPIAFSELLADERLRVKNRRDIKRLYDAAKAAVAEGALALEGHSLPASLNDWILRVEGPGHELKRDSDVVDFSFADDAKLKRWRAGLEPQPKRRKRKLSEGARDLLASLQRLERANAESLGMTNGKKDDVLTALSDLQGAVYTFLDTYDGVQGPLRLPERTLDLQDVEVRSPKAAPKKA